MSDVEQIMGLVQVENIQVHAESYDVALDMSFPKGILLGEFYTLCMQFILFITIFISSKGSGNMIS